MSNITNMNTYNRPKITEEKIETIRQLIEANPSMGRTKLSILLCEMWNWRGPNNSTKDMSCRDVLLALDKAGKIVLPPPQSKGSQPGKRPQIKHLIHDETPIACSLKELRPLRVEEVTSKEELLRFKSYINQYHYLGFDRYIGERMAYMVFSRDGKALACLLFGAAAWSCMERDKWIGWSKETRGERLHLLTNNTRFLIFPFVRVPHLASHILSLIIKRISADWERKYGHPVYLLETFVETGRFKGTCYRAANWLCVGGTTGRGRNGGHHNIIVPIKDIYLYPLYPNAFMTNY